MVTDRRSGKTIRLGATTDCRAQLYPPNQVVYKSIFGENGLRADLRLTYTKYGLESDLVILERPPSPESLGLDPETTRLELYHKWIVGEQPILHPRPTSNVRAGGLRPIEQETLDHTLEFDDMIFIPGEAYLSDLRQIRSLGTPARIIPPDKADPDFIPVVKEWNPDANGGVLIESVSWADVTDVFTVLPASAAIPVAWNKGIPLDQRSIRSTAEVSAMETADTPYEASGLVLDYVTMVAQDNMVFNPAGSQNYTGVTCLTGPISCKTAELRPGCIIKHSGGTDSYLIVWNGITCNCSGNPAIITVKDDDVIRESVPGSTHSPSLNLAYMGLDCGWATGTPPNISGLRVRYARFGLEVQSQGYSYLSDCSFEFCESGFAYAPAGAYGSQAYLNNVTSCGTSYPCPWNQDLVSGSVTDRCSGFVNGQWVNYDTDSNSLADIWEYEKFGYIGVNPSGDADYDGINNMTDVSDPVTWPAFTGDRISPVGGCIVPAPGVTGYPNGGTATFTLSCSPAAVNKEWFLQGMRLSAFSGSTTASLFGYGQQYDGYQVGARLYNQLGNRDFGEPYRLAYLAVLGQADWNRWTNFQALTNNKTLSQLTTIWSAYSYVPKGVPPAGTPTLGWNPNSLIYDKTGFTGISQCNSWQQYPGECAVTALTRRHGYMRGHGNTPGHKVGKYVYFCSRNGTVVPAKIIAAVGHNDLDLIKEQATTTSSNRWVDNSRQDYCLVVFQEDLPASLITPVAVTESPIDISPLHVYLRICMSGTINANVPPFDVGSPLAGGNSGSPDMVLNPNNELVFFQGRTTDGPTAVDFEADLNWLSGVAGISISNPDYQLKYR